MTEEECRAPVESGCFAKVANPCNQLFHHLNFKHPVYPLDPIAPEDSEFFLIDSKTRIRIIHVSPENPLLTPPARYSLDLTSKRSSLSEEYWFTKWNKPVKIGNCNCSFRRSLRFSLLSTQSNSAQENRTTTSFDAAPKRIVDVNSFVERILQETLIEAFQEYYMLKCQKVGSINLGYESTENEDELGVVLRRKQPITKQPNRAESSQRLNNRNSLINKKLPCSHRKNQSKPLIILYHGIGNSSDVWWLIINSLVSKGYEVVAPDMLGHGFSSAPNKANLYKFNNLLIHAVTIFDHYIGNDDKRKCILIGHSYGCSLVSALYRHRASQISQLILISGGGPTPLAAPVVNGEISPFGCVHTLFKPLIFCGLKRSFLFSSRGKHFDICDPEPAIPSQILDYISQGQNWPEGDAAFHRRILVPTLLVHGLQDKQVTLVQQCEMERTIPRAFLELIPNAGHMAMLETPEHLSHMILCFIDTWN